MRFQEILNRREFSKRSSLAAAAAGSILTFSGSPRTAAGSIDETVIPVSQGSSFRVVIPLNSPFRVVFAQRELIRGISRLFPVAGVKAGISNYDGEAPGENIVILSVEEKLKSAGKEAYEIRTEKTTPASARLILSGASEQALLYSVFAFLERQGMFYGLHGETYPLESSRAFIIPAGETPWRGAPKFGVRGLAPWPDFLNCITVFNEEEHRAYLENMLRMRFNMLGIHVYSGASQWAESFLSFEYGGAGHISFTDTSATHRWGYLPERTSRFGMSGAQYFDSEVFGSDATRLARNTWEAAERAQALWRESFRFAEKLGIKTGVGFEPYSVPDEIYRAVPPEAHYVKKEGETAGPRIDPESVAARDILEARLGALLETYPSVGYVWLWEDEGMSWESQRMNVPLSTTPFEQAHAFLKRHAPDKRLVVSGWGGVARHFLEFHRKLPGDIIFSCLSDNLGWDPVHEVFGQLEDRERWPIPWLEDDPGMWLPQFHVHRFERDMNLAEEYGCTGLLGIHWRHRIMDINAGFQAKFSWRDETTPGSFMRDYAGALVHSSHRQKFADGMLDIDKNRSILNSFTGEIRDGHHVVQGFSGDYSEAFTFWDKRKIDEEILNSQKLAAASLRELVRDAISPEEAERIEYIASHIDFLIPFAESWREGNELHALIQDALKLKREGRIEDAKSLAREKAVPLWKSLAVNTRAAILAIQRIVSDRNDLGTLASMHNKYERLVLHRLRLSLKEILGELPEDVDTHFRNLAKPDDELEMRLIVPTRPGILEAGKETRLTAIAPGTREPVEINIGIRMAGEASWIFRPMFPKGRRTWEGIIGQVTADVPYFDYYVEARFSGPEHDSLLAAPLEAPVHFYRVTVI